MRNVLLAALAVAACQDTARHKLTVVVNPGVLQFTATGVHQPVRVEALDAKKQPVLDATFAWHSTDTSVATVKDGIVTSVNDGIVRIWAVSGTDSAFAVAVVQLPGQQVAAAPPQALTVTPGILRFDAIGDTASVTVAGWDTLGPPPVCVTERDAVATIDAAYHLLTAGNGTTLVRCKAGEAEGTMRVVVQQRIARVGIVTGLTRTLRLERDTLHLVLARVDRRDTPVNGGAPRWRSLDTAVVAVDPRTGYAVGVAEGDGRVVATLGALADTTKLTVIAREPSMLAARPQFRVGGPALRQPRPTAPGGGAPGATPNRGPRPAETLVGARAIAQQDSVFQLQAALISRSEPPLHISATVYQADHRFDLALGDSAENTSGLLLGGEVDYFPSPRFRIQLEGMTGTLTGHPTAKANTADQTANMWHLDAGIGVLSWLWLNLGGGARAYRDAQSGTLEAWQMVRAGFEARFNLGGDAAQGIIGVTTLPIVHAGSASPFGYGGVAGITFRTGRLVLGTRYELEAYSFPDARRDQFGLIRFRLGLNLGGP